ncbi:uncharacterized protein EDC45_1546 [Mesocricetibacter intestinalis]|uniref:TPM domain-containing protein n=1 Tax=Mesocricetibacter intestinalis TaxID=1521930 RepID=A0A4R6V724_9PAST|nr:YgcG family protein [Mesocricetibacter intestinalis]TDQ57153.1 uncharacterized protein EDC45_1546 [Mesocricetibacter intestinalis]
MNKLLKRAVFFCLLFFGGASFAVTFPPTPEPFSYVNDYTRTLSATDKQLLEHKLSEYGRETSSQIAVVIIPSTQEYEISDYTFALGDRWGIGRKQLNNGVLMLIAKNDRKVFIATGQGLEGVLPDAFLAQVIRRTLLPYFKQGQYAQGIDAALNEIIAASKGEFDAAAATQGLQQYIPYLIIALFILFIVLGEIGQRRRPYLSPSANHQLQSAIRRSVLNRRGGGNGGFGGGGFGGGSGGGFGGGSFGGGGAGGSW